MEYKEAEALLPKFEHLIGKHSITYGKKITDVFTGFEDAILTGQMHWFAGRVKKFASIPSDAGRYTLCAAFEDKNIVSIKSIVLKDNLVDLIPDAESLSYMTSLQRGKTKVEDAYLQI
jgi:hypothetical protein